MWILGGKEDIMILQYKATRLFLFSAFSREGGPYKNGILPLTLLPSSFGYFPTTVQQPFRIRLTNVH